MSSSFDKYDNIQYCAKEMQTNFATNFRQSASEFSLSQTKFRRYLGEISHPLKRNFFLPKFPHDENSHPQNFAIAKIRTREISPGRKFALAIFPQSEISLEMEAGCNENPRSDCCVCCTCTCNCLE